MFEIYYTSAPSGLKRGSSGFCTVAASANIPKPLLERLEGLSAYRHHFGQGQSGTNPVAHAHWRLVVGGREFHVLSRVCDSGVDHTHRTNAFAHHVALEGTELSPAGPADLLLRPGVMMAAWDGRVGELTRTTLPALVPAAPSPCQSWAALAGDAGYAGLLLEAAIKNPAKPVTILFAPQQDMLGLIADVLRLLPAAARWSVTCSTYFTSMPTSATCAWRCCLAQTVAASTAARSGGLLLDLAEPDKLPALVENDFVASARAGIPVAGPERNSRATLARPAASTPPKPPRPVVDEGEDLQSEIALAVEKYRQPDPPAPPAAPPAPPAPVYAAAPELELRPVADPPPAAPPARLSVAAQKITGVESLLARPASGAEQRQQQRRQQMMVVYALAVIAVGTAIWMVYAALRVPRETTMPLTTRPRPVERTVVETPPDPPETPLVPTTQVIVPPTTAVAVPTTVKVETQPVKVVETLPAKLPSKILLASLEAPAAAGVRTRVQQVQIPAEHEPLLRETKRLRLEFPDGREEYRLDWGDVAGVLSATSTESPLRGNNRGPNVHLRWKARTDLNAAEVAALALRRNRGANGGYRIDVTWQSGFAIKRPEVAAAAYWVLAQSTVLAVGAGGERNGARKLQFAPLESASFDLAQAEAALKLPVEPPPGTTPTVGSSLPAGWSATVYTDWTVKDILQRREENKVRTLRFKYPTSALTIDAWFTVTFTPQFAGIESNFAARLASDESERQRCAAERTSLDSQIAQLTEEAQREIAKYQEMKYTQAAENRKLKLQQDLAALAKKRTELEAAIQGYTTAVAAYRKFETLDVVLKLPNEMPAAKIRFTRGGK